MICDDIHDFVFFHLNFEIGRFSNKKWGLKKTLFPILIAIFFKFIFWCWSERKLLQNISEGWNKTAEEGKENNVTRKMTFPSSSLLTLMYHFYAFLPKRAFEWINRKKCLKISLFHFFIVPSYAIFTVNSQFLELLLLLKNKSHWRGVKKRVMEILWLKKKCESSFNSMIKK